MFDSDRSVIEVHDAMPEAQRFLIERRAGHFARQDALFKGDHFMRKQRSSLFYNRS